MTSFGEELLAVYDNVHARLLARLDGLTDDEYLWEPVPGGWAEIALLRDLYRRREVSAA